MRDREKAEAYLTSGCDGCGAPVGGFVSCSGCLASLTALLDEVRRDEREAIFAELLRMGYRSNGTPSFDHIVEALRELRT